MPQTGDADNPEKMQSSGQGGPMKPMRCPICDAAMPGNWQDYPDYPFCSKRCRIIDLGRWLNEEYRIAAAEADDDRSTPPSSPED